jgi:adenylate cyclase
MPVAIYEALEHYTDESFPRRAELLEAFNAGVVGYRRRDWNGAHNCFRQALAANPDDGPAKIYLARCEIYRTTPPAAEWDGVWTMPGK